MEGLLAGGTIVNGVQIGINDYPVGNFPTVSATTIASANPGNVATLKTATNAGAVYINSAQNNITPNSVFQTGGAITPTGYYDILGAGTNGTLYSIIGQNTFNGQLYYTSIFPSILSETDRVAVETQNTGVQPATNSWITEWPPIALNASSTGGTIYSCPVYGQPYGNGVYIITASTTYSTSAPWYAFDKIAVGSFPICWASAANYNGTTGVYAGTASITGLGTGEWLQIQLPTAIYLQSYSLTCIQSGGIGQAPSTYYVAGSNNGTSWTIIDSRTGINWVTQFQTQYFTLNSPSIVAYSYYVIICSAVMAGNGYFALDEWRLFGNQYPIYKIPGFINFKPTPVFALDRLSPIALASANALYSVRRLFSTWTSPVIQIRRAIDSVTLDFYGDQYGTLISATGLSVQNFIGGTTTANSIGYVTVWYDQSGKGANATQPTTTLQPAIDWVNARVDFTAQSGTAYMSMPNSTMPTGDQSYTISFKHAGTASVGNNIVVVSASALSTYVNQQTLEIIVINTRAIAIGWQPMQWNTGASWPNAGIPDTITTSYITGGGTNSMIIYQNGTSAGTNSPGTTRATLATYNYIGNSPWRSAQYLGTQLNYLAIFSSALTSTYQSTTSSLPSSDQTVIESQANFADPYYSNVVLLLHGDYDFTDTSQYNAILTTSGTAPTINATATYIKFGAGSIAFGGAGYLVTPTSNNYNLGNQNFTIEFWMYITTIGSGNYALFDGTLWRIIFSGGALIFQCYASATNVFVTSNSQFSNATMYHVAVVRNGNTLSIYSNGAIVPLSSGSGLLQYPLTSTAISIGGSSYGNSPSGTYLDEIRITIGVARYTAPFTPPAQPFGPLEWPPIAMTSSANSGQLVTGQSYGNGTYTVTSSSQYGNSISLVNYEAFDKSVTPASNSNTWLSGNGNNGFTSYTSALAYIGPYFTNGIGGEWLQIQLPCNIILTGYSLGGGSIGTQWLPSSWYIFGSLDGAHWYQLDSRSVPVNTIGTSPVNPYTINGLSLPYYKYFRLVITRNNNTTGFDICGIGEWKLYGY